MTRSTLPCLLLLAPFAGCGVAHAPMSDSYGGPQELPVAISDRFEREAAPPPAPSADDPERKFRLRGFTVREITLPAAAADASPIEFEYYDVDGDEPKPVVVVLPIFNGQPIVTRYFARYFAQQGWAALALGRERDPLDHLNEPEQTIRDNLRDYRRVLDWVTSTPEHEQDAVGVFGISFGGVDAVMLAAVDDRVNALVAAMAGGDLSYLFTHTSYRRVSRAVDGLLERTGLTREALQHELDERIATDPVSLAPYVDAARTLMIMTLNDVIVPTEAQELLRSSMGAPETVYLPTGHRTSIVYFPRLRSTAYDFFARQFMAATP